MRTAYAPGLIIPARPTSPDVLLQDWKGLSPQTQYRESSPFNPPSEGDLVDIEWNAGEAIRQGRRLLWLPRPLRALMLPMDRANACLIYSLKKVTEAWSQSLHPMRFENLPEPELSELCQLGESAGHWYHQAKGKFNALVEHRRPLQQFSLRQWRLHLFTSRCLDDLATIVQSLAEKVPHHIEKESAKHLVWHTEALHRHFTGTHKPGMLERFQSPRSEITRLAAMACRYHADFLRSIGKPQ